jgi:AcrR family transcriptional regulator
MGIAERKEADKNRMRRLILDTAMGLFLDEGFENVSIRRIAENIEYSPATIYRYFQDKNEILYALHSMGFERLYERQQTTLGIRDPWRRLMKQAELYFSFAMENPEFYDLMFIMSGIGKKIKEKKDWEGGLYSFEFLKNNIQECMDAGYLNKADLDVAAFALWSFTHGISSLIIRDRCIMFPEEQVPMFVEMALDFLMSSINQRGDRKGNGPRKKAAKGMKLSRAGRNNK